MPLPDLDAQGQPLPPTSYRPPGATWSPEEDAAVLRHVEKNGPERWAACAESLASANGGAGRTAAACGQRYRHYLEKTGAERGRAPATAKRADQRTASPIMELVFGAEEQQKRPLEQEESMWDAAAKRCDTSRCTRWPVTA